MNIKYLFNLIVLFLLTGCSISGTVVDSDTGKPIKGAVVLAQWTKTKGLLGMTYHKVYKIVEVETDKEGKYTISGILNPFVDSPEIVVYKEGYVTYRNDYIFPTWEKRKEKMETLIKLRKWDESYSHDEHHSFMIYAIMADGLNSVPKFHESLNKESTKGRLEEKRQMQEEE